MSAPRNRSRQIRLVRWLADHLWLVLPLLFVAMILLFYPFRFVFEFNTDEGLQLIRSLLYLRGHRLYGEIYNDQPPLLTLLLSGVFSALGFNVTLGRLLILGLSTGLMMAALAYLQATWGRPHVIAGWLLFLLLPRYRQLSVSVMTSLPAAALAMVSFWGLARWHRARSTPWLLVSGAALSLSALTKAFTGILVPIFGVGLLASELRREPPGGWRHKLRPAVIWSLAFLLPFGVIALLAIGSKNLPQLVRVHLVAREVEGYLELSDTLNINFVLREAWSFVLLGGLGGLLALAKKERTSLYLVAWGVGAYGALSVVLPVWFHHQMFVTIPALLLGAILLGEMATKLTGSVRARVELKLAHVLSAIGLIGAIVILSFEVPQFFHGLTAALPNLRGNIRPEDRRAFSMLARMWEHADQTHLIVTDRPMFAFRLRKSVPPELAVISEKRLWTGSITEQQIIEVIDAARPEQVLLIRFDMEQVEAHLSQEYDVIYRYGPWRLHLRRGLGSGADDPSPALHQPAVPAPPG